MLRPRTIRQRQRRANKAQVAAVATVLGLLIVVSFIADFVLDELPGEIATAEFDHVVQVENQFARLQSTVLAQSQRSNLHLDLSSPITLGSASVPPFGAPSAGYLGPESALIKTETSYSIGEVVAKPPNWNFGSNCLSGGGGHCSGNGHVDTWNVTGQNHTSFTITVTGNSNSARYNISGNNDTITINWNGGDTGFVDFIINGSNDVINYNKGGSDVTSPIAEFDFFGQSDVFNFNPSGSHSSGGGMTLFVEFIGSLNFKCPYTNLSNTDKVGILGAGGSNLNMSVTWWNSLGYSSGPTFQQYPGGSGNNESIYWQNETGVVSCAFTQAFGSTYQVDYSSGIVAHLFNKQDPATDVAFDQGAVIESQVGGRPLMVVQPPFYFSTNSLGLVANVTLFNVVSNQASETGIDTASVASQVLSVHTLAFRNGAPGTFFLSPYYLNFTTYYPNAWLTYLDSERLAFPSGVGCQPTVAIAAPYTCQNPPPGIAVTIIAPLFAQSLTVTTVTVQLNII